MQLPCIALTPIGEYGAIEDLLLRRGGVLLYGLVELDPANSSTAGSPTATSEAILIASASLLELHLKVDGGRPVSG